ncbi:MAG: acyltransferase [Syntrophorhabdaceae bacterium]
MEHDIILAKLKGKTLSELASNAVRFGRGYLTSLQFERTNPVSVRGRIRIYKSNGSISVGKFTDFWPDVKLSCHGRGKMKARISIGERCSIGDRTEIHSGSHVQIGNDTMIAWDCVILDRDYHGIGGTQESLQPVVIGKGVWIGCRGLVLKGVTIGDGAIIGAGAVVTNNIPAYTLAAGNPARIIGKVH